MNAKQLQFTRRLSRLRQRMKEHRLEALRLTQQKNVSWLTGGRSHVNTASEPACMQWIISEEECVFIANNIEHARLLEEEIGFRASELITDMEVWPWHEPAQLAATVKRRTSRYRTVQTDLEAESWLIQVRTVFDDVDLPTLKEAGMRTSEALEQTAMEISRGDSEYMIAGRLAYHCWLRELEPIVNLIAVDERTLLRRHPLPTAKRLDQTAMLVVCTRHNGYIVSATRMVHFGRLSDVLDAKMKAVTNIDARIIERTRPGVSGGELFIALRQLYADNGYAEEFAQHHQGGLTGYSTREQLAVQDAGWQVASGHMIAWNPSIAGVKSEDTIIVRDDGFELITPVELFPVITVETGTHKIRRPGILLRK